MYINHSVRKHGIQLGNLVAGPALATTPALDCGGIVIAVVGVVVVVVVVGEVVVVDVVVFVVVDVVVKVVVVVVSGATVVDLSLPQETFW